MNAVQIDVSTTSRTYQVHVGEGITEHLNQLLDNAGATERRFLVSSPSVWKAHGATIEQAVRNDGTILVPDGERSKTTQTVSRIYEALFQASADRATTIVAVEPQSSDIDESAVFHGVAAATHGENGERGIVITLL